MNLTELHVSGYRSLRSLRLSLGRVNVVTGPNGSGKSNLYNALSLLSRVANGGLAQAIAMEGGMGSVLWAGPRRKARKNEPVRMTMAAITDTFSYEVRIGLPTPRITMFDRDPEVKEEYVWHGRVRKPSTTFLRRDNSGCQVRDRDARRVPYSGELGSSESILSQLREPHLYPEISMLREEMLRWRFYHHFRTDPESPLRQPQPGVWTPILYHDGRDLAAAVQTIIESEKGPLFHENIDAAFPGARVVVEADGPRFRFTMEVPGLLRPLQAQEFSDGTLRYLCLVAALLSPRPGGLVVLNEPETSLHPDLLEPLARLIADSRQDSQVLVTTHSQPLAEWIGDCSGSKPIVLELEDGATQIVGQGLLGDRGED